MKIAIVGNCQSRPLAELLLKFNDQLKIPNPIIIHLAKPADAEQQLDALTNADCILTQLVADNYPVEHLQTNRLKQTFSSKTVVWPNIFFSGQNPDLAYVTGAGRSRVVGPMGDYHSRSIWTAWQNGVALDQLDSADYVSRYQSIEDIQTGVQKSFDELKTREEKTDVVISDEIESQWTQKKLFHTFNHPTPSLLVALRDRIAAYVDIKPNSRLDNGGVCPDRLAIVLPPMEQTLADLLGFQFEVSTDVKGVEVTIGDKEVLTGKSTDYNFRQFADLSYACYDAQIDLMSDVRLTPQ